MEAPPALARLRTEIEPALRHSLDGGLPPDLAARYVMGWQDEHGEAAEAGGKRIRPALCLLAAEAVGGSREQAMPGAVAIELVHNFSLVHDDIQDGDEERHHRPTAWRVWGQAQAINLGDYMITAALAPLLASPAPAEQRLAAVAAINTAIARMILGQWADLDFEDRLDITVDDYDDMVRGKTGALLAASLEVGAILGGAPPDVSQALARWGELVGLAFQARDDELGIWGEPKATGKSATNDLVRRKKSLPVVLGLADATARPVIEALFTAPEADAGLLRVAVTALEGAGARDATQQRAQAWQVAADGILSGLNLPGEAARDLARFSEFSVARMS